MPPETINGTLCATAVRHCRVADLGNLWEVNGASGPEHYAANWSERGGLVANFERKIAEQQQGNKHHLA